MAKISRGLRPLLAWAAASNDPGRKLLAVTDAALSHLELDELLDELVDQIRELLDADTCAFLLVDKETGELVARAASGIEEEVEQGVRIPLGAGFAGRIAETQLPLSIVDVDRADIVNPILREKEIRSLVGAPLLAHGKVLGVVHAGTLTRRRFGAADEHLLQLAADRAALGVERALLHDELVVLNNLKDDFIAFASHELRNPAAALALIAGLLDQRREALTPEQMSDLIDSLRDESRRLTRLIDQLLDLSRLDAGAIAIKREHLRVRQQVDAIVKAATAGGRGDAIEVDIPEALEVDADPRALDRIVSNLITNAFRYGQPPVRIEAEQRDTHFRLRVEDNGPGVAPDFVPRLFSRFTRDPSADAIQGSSGLGLAIVQAYATAHGGSVVYSPRTPHGASFELAIPNRGVVAG